MAKDIGIIIPSYNEEKNIGDTIKRLQNTIDAEIIVVDDHSSDRTQEIAGSLGVKVIRHKENRGKGEALATGFREILKNHPKIEYIIVIDADSQYNPEDAPKLIKKLKEGSDYVIGARMWKRDVPFRHRLGNFIWRKTFNILFRVSMLDTNCGYIGMNRKSLKIMSKGSYGGYIIDNMMLAKAIENNLEITQVPVKVHYPEKRGVVRGVRFVLGCWIFIIEEGFKYSFGIELKLYQKLMKTGLIFSKEG